MATKKLSEILGSKQGVDLEFVSLQIDETRDGQQIVRLVLKDNIPIVYGRTINDTVTGDRVRVEATDVEMVAIGPDAIKLIEELEAAEMLKPEAERVMPFAWTKEGESGTLKLNNFRLDVSNQQEVWITKEGFAAFAANRRRTQRQQQTTALVTKIRESKTKQEFANADPKTNLKPEAVDKN